VKKKTVPVLVIAAGAFLYGYSAANGRDQLVLTLRSRPKPAAGCGQSVVTETVKWQASRTAIIVCDMWDRHHCISAERRVAEMAPVMNDVLKCARDSGVFVIHAPSGCMDFYADTAQRRRAENAPYAEAPVEFGWKRPDGDREQPMPVPSGCSCESPNPCGPSRGVWTRQTDLIEIAAEDAISDSGQEVYNLMALRRIDNVILMGVHTNICVLGRPFGLRSMVSLGKNVVLCRDLTDSYHRGPGKHFEGLDKVIGHVEKFVCPSITSTGITGTRQFRFKADKRPRIVFVIGEDEYDAQKTLPEFAGELGNKYGFCCEFAQAVPRAAGEKQRNNISGMELLQSGDLAVIYVRRRALPTEQMNYLRDFVDSGRPLIGLRTASHAFALRNRSPAPGYADWPEFDRQVLGGNYHGHHGNKSADGPRTYVWIKPGAESHPIPAGVPDGEIHVRSWLYKVLPLAATTQVLMMGRVGERRPHEPVAWTNIRPGGGRVFYTSLGHADDFKLEAFRRMLTNAVFWALGSQGPGETNFTRESHGHRH